MLLFNNNNSGDAEISALATWASGHKFAYLQESILIGLRWLKAIVGNECVAQLDAFYRDSGLSGTSTERQAVELAQRAVLNEAYRVNLPKASVHINNAGVQVPWNENFRPALGEKTDLLASLRADAFNFANLLVEEMDAAPLIFTEWANSSAKERLKNILFPSVFVFDDFFSLSGNQAEFYALFAHIQRAQNQYVKPIVGDLWPSLVAWAHGEATDSFDDLILFNARTIAAHGGIYLRSLADYTELMASGGEASRIQSRLATLGQLQQHTKANVDAYGQLLRDAIAASQPEPEPPLAEVIKPDAYLPIAGGNSLFL